VRASGSFRSPMTYLSITCTVPHAAVAQTTMVVPKMTTSSRLEKLSNIANPRMGSITQESARHTLLGIEMRRASAAHRWCEPVKNISNTCADWYLSRKFCLKKEHAIGSVKRNIFRPADFSLRGVKPGCTRMEPRRRIITDDFEIDHKTSRSICHEVGERLQQDLRLETSPLPPNLNRLIDELRKRDN
jgi:hypothetical protein